MKNTNLLTIFLNGVLWQNPTFIQLIGMCPVLAVSTTLENGFGMGVAATAVLICSNVVISLMRKIIPNKIRIAIFVVVIAGFVTIVDLLMQAYTPALSSSLGVFIPLIVVNCIIIARAEAFACKNDVLSSAVDGLGMGLGFTLAMCLLSSIRELLGSGTILGYSVFGPSFQPALMIILPAGGFLTLGILIAFMQFLMNMGKKGAESK